ncbi:mitochondrial ribosomal protein subunit-domain-containing protein [Phellopilus nigrolimitatus]|nr:mitochondrial ribosomal protein subunit-domain-containing protein [Phellopilus nigrolimitatus]
MSAASVKAVKPPTPFSVLLRRSKFASYDPKINQIYTTHGGSAARGDWGLKRPLTVRRRDGRLNVRSVDTLYQQTEWISAYTDSEWVRKFEEMGVVPGNDPSGSWALRIGQLKPDWLHDSDYVERVTNSAEPGYLKKAENDPIAFQLKLTTPTPDPRAMNDKRFERYLRRVRQLRPEFEPFLKAEEAKKKMPSTASFGPASSRPPHYKQAKVEFTRTHREFLADKFAEACATPDSKVIRPLPHPTAGLTYTQSSDLQNVFSTNPLPGRRLHVNPHGEKTTAIPFNVAVAGWVGKEAVMKSERVSTTDWGLSESEPRKDVKAGLAKFKPKECELVNPPRVVGKHPQGLSASSFRMEFLNWDDANAARPNPHRPGTREYVAHQERTHSRIVLTPPPKYGSNGHLTPPRKFLDKRRESNEMAGGLIQELQGLVKKPKGADEGEGDF